VTAPEPEQQHPLIDKLHARREQHRRRAKPVRVLFAMAGATLLLGGIAMLVLPGPAFVVLPLGLFLLALEFTWAERALVRSLTQAERARARAAGTTRTQRMLTAAAAAMAAAGAVLWAVLGDIPLLPV
jgi:uncharacterized protein (TIGR02611 family)